MAGARPGCQNNDRSALSSGQLVEQRLRLLQIARVKPFGEPAVDRSEQIAGLIPLALVAPEPGETGGGAQLEASRPLLPRDGDGGKEGFLRWRCIGRRAFDKSSPRMRCNSASDHCSPVDCPSARKRSSSPMAISKFPAKRAQIRTIEGLP